MISDENSRFGVSGKFGYHFAALEKDYDPNYYDYRDVAAESEMSKEPIVYKFTPPLGDSSEEDPFRGTDSIDYFVVGVENLLLMGEYKDDQHLVLLVSEESDGLPPINVDDAEYYDGENDEQHYFPDADFVFIAEDGPTYEDLRNISETLDNFIMQGKC